MKSNAAPQRPPFLTRTTFGQANYLLMALVAAFVVALIPLGARRAIESNSNRAEDWLPTSYTEVADLSWFRNHFQDEQFALVSWDGCTLGNTEKLDQLSRKLVPSQDALASSPADSELRQRAKWFRRVVTGPGILAELTAPPLSLDYDEAVGRLEGALVGPAERDAHGHSLGNRTRTTCLVVYLHEAATKDKRTMRQAIDTICDIAVTECAIPRETLRMAGPPVDSITIDAEGERTLMQFAAVAAMVGFVLSYCCFRSAQVTILVLVAGILCAALSLALVFYCGVLEVALTGAGHPGLGTVDALLLTMPAVIYVLGLSGAIRIVNYYRDARREQGIVGAAEAAIRQAWWPCILTAVATALGVGSLITSDILPIKKFGLFAGISVVAAVALLFLIIPALLSRFPLRETTNNRASAAQGIRQLPGWATSLFGFVTGHNIITGVLGLAVVGVLGIGLTRLESSAYQFRLLDEKTDLLEDYAWLKKHLGNVVPLELVITVPPERCRTPDEHAEQDGKQYRMTMLERLNMIREIQFRIELFPEISRALSAATFAPSNTTTGVSAAADRTGDYALNKNLEEQRTSLLAGDYLRLEPLTGSSSTIGRELWRVSARVATIENPGNRIHEIDYSKLLAGLRSAIDPVLVAYQQRDMIVRALHERGKQLDGAQLCILYRTADNAPEPTFATQESALANLLLKSNVRPKTLPDGRRLPGLTFYNLTDFDAHADEPRYLDKAVHALSEQDALILVSASSDPTAKKFADGGLPIIDVTNVSVEDTSAATEVAATDNPRAIRSIYTGIVPVIATTHQHFLLDTKNSMLWATLTITVIMMLVMRSAVAGLTTMLPIFFPIVATLGILGWAGANIDIGIMIGASVALGIALEGTIHFIFCFRRASAAGQDRIQAVKIAYERCATPMVQTAIIAGLGLTVFAFSTFTPTQQFGLMMISTVAATLAGNLLILPAIIAGPLGYYFTAKTPCAAEQPVPIAIMLQGGEIAPRRRHDPVPTPGPVAEQISPRQKLEFPVVAQPKPPLIVPKRVSGGEGQKEVIDGPHADLHTRLRNLRRDPSQGYMSS